MATLKITHYASVFSQGGTTTFKQGASANARATPFELTVAGDVFPFVSTSLVTGAGRLLYDSTVDFPATYLYGAFWADQDCYLQCLSGATEATFDITKEIPFTIPKRILASATTTNLTAEPTLAAIDEITLWNESGSTINYRGFLVL